jgi:hypothetical protein
LVHQQISERRRSNLRSLTGPRSTTPSSDDQCSPNSWRCRTTLTSSCGCPQIEDH